ncbi:PhnD/SsuA/transferrin family substrate-binding protein [Nitrosopumilus sp. K4]|uniref:phosphate/phosphite/phosphonate ABC transporter substrate-binding protein n=1 Tax=Nitrosopumilus sp. K4 TaxID=2795383 RepID=UPI001BA5129D|nr:PhnD/SsuA/transferrin family substrate-binding protein [Nitrosopumilus sp. K4]QUC65514.1 PhnD/SsuA/transferrin family substrate-binding protein [Nitrosopumilus sp. K4]
MKKILLTLLSFLVIGIVLFVVFQSYDEKNSDLSQKTITIATIHRDASKMTDRFQPMANYIAEKVSDGKTTYSGRVMIPDSIDELVMYLNDGEIDIFIDSPLVGLFVANQTDISPTLFAWKENSFSYHTVFIAPKDLDISMDTLHRKTIVFEDTASSSGYFLPKLHLEDMGYVFNSTSQNNIFFKFSEDDQNTPVWILEGRGDFGSVSNIDYEEFPERIKNQLKIIGKTSEIPRQLVFFSNSLNDKEILEKIFLDMETNADPVVLEDSKISKFSPLNPDADLEETKKLLGLE